MARVITICTGKDAGFGIFDAHEELYAKTDRAMAGVPHSKALRDTIQGIANFIKSIEDPAGANHALHGKVTLVISSEYGRNNNFAGSLIAYDKDYDPTQSSKEDDESDQEDLRFTNEVGMLGNGHFFPNNNYIFYGKGVKSGVWLGESDPVSRFPYCADFSNLASAKPQDIAAAFLDPLAPRPAAGGKLSAKQDYSKVGVSFDPNDLDASIGVPHKKGQGKKIRALLARDVVRTIMHCAGLGDKYEQFYGRDDSEALPAYAIKQLVDD